MSRSGKLGLAICALMALVVVLGPVVAPHDPTAVDGVPLSPPGDGYLLGTDALGRDLFSRVLAGGRSVLLLAAGATALTYLMAVPLGLLGATLRGPAEGLLMRSLDVLLAFPALLLLLIFAATRGPGATTVVVAVAITQVPGLARIVRAAALEVSVKPYVDAARVRGERAGAVMFGEILPNVRTTLLTDAGMRLTLSILLISAANYLGLGVRPPQPDWGLMVAENQDGLALQPLAVLVPALMIALLTVGINLVADAFGDVDGALAAEESAVRPQEGS